MMSTRAHGLACAPSPALLPAGVARSGVAASPALAVAVASAFALFGSASAVPAQFGGSFENPQTAQEQASREMARARLRLVQEQRRREEQMMFPFSAAPRGAPLPFHLGFQAGLRQLFPHYGGLQTYPANLPGSGGYPGAGKVPGYGGYPAAGKVPGTGEVTMPKIGVPGAKRPGDTGRWPSWIEGGVRKTGERASVSQAVLVRVTDRVWLRATGEPEFVPLAFYDRFRFLETGSQVEVRGKGEFQVVMHDGASIRSRGLCSLAVAALGDKLADLRLQRVENVWIAANTRPVRVQLPDGTSVEFTASLLHLERRGDRVRVSNLGSGPIRFRGSAGNGVLEGPQFIRVWVAPPAAVAVGESLQLQGRVTKSESAAVVTFSGGDEGRVTWSGASFEVPAGSSLTVQPLKSLASRR